MSLTATKVKQTNTKLTLTVPVTVRAERGKLNVKKVLSRINDELARCQFSTGLPGEVESITLGKFSMADTNESHDSPIGRTIGSLPMTQR